METNIILYGMLLLFVALAIFAFRDGNRQKRGLKFRNKPDFTPLKLDESQINDHSKF